MTVGLYSGMDSTSIISGVSATVEAFVDAAVSYVTDFDVFDFLGPPSSIVRSTSGFSIGECCIVFSISDMNL